MSGRKRIPLAEQTCKDKAQEIKEARRAEQVDKKRESIYKEYGSIKNWLIATSKWGSQYPERD